MNKEIAITITLKEYEELLNTKKKYEELKEVIDKAIEFTNKNWGQNSSRSIYEIFNC